MRVLFITHNFPRHPGDLPGNFILRLARALKETGVEIQVLAPHAPRLTPVVSIETIPVERFRYAPERRETLAYEGTMAAQVRNSLRAKLDMIALIRAGAKAVQAHAVTADVVHAHWWFPGGLAVTRAAARGKPIVTTLHGSDVRFARGTVARALMSRVLARSARVTAVSQWLADEAARLGGIDAPRVAPMPVETDMFTPSDTPRDGVLFVGKLDDQKGPHVLLEALAQLPSRISGTFVGDGPNAQMLHARAAALGVAGRVRWCGALPQEALASYYRAARVVVAPATEAEGLGLVAAESMLCETPVIASKLGGLPDLVEDGVTGRLVPPSDPKALAAAIETSLASPERLAQWGKTGRARVLDRMSPAACAATYRAIYEEVASANKA